MIPLLLLLPLVAGQHHALNHCPQVAPVQGFRPDKFLGSWHVQKQFRVPAEDEMTCKSITFNSDGSLHFDFSARSKPYTVPGEFLVDSGAEGIIKGIFQYSDVLGSQDSGEVIWYIIDTDYTDFAILTACHQEALLHKQYVYILSRKQNLNEYEEAFVDVKFRNIYYPSDGTLFTRDNSECQLDPTEPTNQTNEEPMNQVTELEPVITPDDNLIEPAVDPEPEPNDAPIDENKGEEQPTTPSSSPAETVLEEETPVEGVNVDSNSFGPEDAPEYLVRSALDKISAMNQYRDIFADGNPRVANSNQRILELVRRMQHKRSFVNWKDIVDDANVEKVTSESENSFVRSLRKRPNFLELAVALDNS